MDNEKLVAWLTKAWNVKERIVFGLMVCVLGFRVYQLLVEPPEPPEPPPPPPIEYPYGVPEPPPKTPAVDTSESALLYAKPDMFTQRKADEGGGIDETGKPKETDLVLHSIQAMGPMAQLSMGEDGSKRFVREGDVFESDYTVREIDPDKGEVKVYHSETKKTYTLTIEEK